MESNKQEIHPGVEAGVKMALDQLSDPELAAFNNSITWGSGNMRKDCERMPWFSKVESLFTADEGKNIHPEAMKVIADIVANRLA